MNPQPADVHPEERFDVVILGAGQAGGPLSTALADAGWKVALIERKHVGGTCVNEGCTPTKTMVASARVAYLARRAADYGVTTGPVSVNLHAVRERKREIVKSFRDGSRRRIEGTSGVELIRGEGRFVAPKTVQVTASDAAARRLSAGRIVINTGTRPRSPSLPGLERIEALDSTSIMELADVPEHLLILGGGYIGVEFGQMFRRFGSRVTIVQRGAQLLAREDDDVAQEVAKILREDGVDVLLETHALRVGPGAHGGIDLVVRAEAEERTLHGSHLLVAAGRTPNTDRLGLEAAGIVVNGRGFIPVDEHLQTAIEGIYAAGDVNGGPAFTHIAYDDYRMLRSRLLDGGEDTTSGRLVPYTVFMDPQLGRIGLTEKQAREQGIAFRFAKIPMRHVARALETDETRGLMKALVAADSDQILGAAILGIEGGEVMTVLQMAMMGGLPYTALRDGVFAHPTIAESLNTLFSSLSS
jgi:pyruvate/2-oxoglutarate dehydrogenase complex dihydrolipoamide dehydrogenase (E3) component